MEDEDGSSRSLLQERAAGQGAGVSRPSQGLWAADCVVESIGLGLVGSDFQPCLLVTGCEFLSLSETRPSHLPDEGLRVEGGSL